MPPATDLFAHRAWATEQDKEVRQEEGRGGLAVPRFALWLALIAVGALVLRAVVVLKTQNEWVASDGFWYSAQANQMAHGKLFVNPLTGHPDALHPPAWVAVLTAFALLGGHTWLQQQLLASLIGTATVVVIGLAGRRIAGDRVGLVAAGIAAMYAGLWVYERALLSETLLLPVIAVVILLAYRFRDHPSAKRAMVLGGVCGLLALIRSEQILLVPLLLVPLILTATGLDWRRRLTWLALATATLLVVLAPWTTYNLARFQQPVLLSTGLGYAAAGANCDASYYGPNTGWTTARCSIQAALRTRQSSDVSVADAEDRRAALTYAEHHVARLPIVLVAREGRAFGFWSPLRQTVLDSELRSQWSVFLGGGAHGRVNVYQAHPPSDLWVGRLALIGYWLLLLPAVVGAVFLRRRRIALYPLIAFIATIVVAVVIAFGDSRYRAGAEVSLVLLAAIGIDAVLPGPERLPFPKRTKPGQRGPRTRRYAPAVRVQAPDSVVHRWPSASSAPVLTDASVSTPDELELWLPDDDEHHPEVSIVIPAVDESLTVATFIGWCKEGLQAAGARGEILIVDSSDDDTPKIARASGARVLRTPRRGLGRAYIDALPYIRGQYVLMGDADCTYDFRQLDQFVRKLREGYEFVMGSRWTGEIEPGSMPRLHRYVGTPITTWILNQVYSSHFSDIHCGMRGITRDALERMGLTSQSWEYASEMVLKSVRMDLPTAEVPVHFLRDREGRVSHHRRSGWTSPFQAAWINLQAMFVYGADYFVLKPGAVVLALGLVLTAPLTFGDVTIGAVHFSLSWMLLGVTLVILGMQGVYFGCLAQVLSDYSGRTRARWLSIFRYTRTVLLSAVAFLVGLGLAAGLVVRYVRDGLSLPSSASSDIMYHLAVTGLMLMIAGFSTFAFTLLLRASGVRYGRVPHVDA